MLSPLQDISLTSVRDTDETNVRLWSRRSIVILLLLGVGEDVGLEVGGLGKLLVAAVEGADVGSVARVDAHVRPQVEVQREALPATLERALQVRRKWGISSGLREWAFYSD